MIYFDNAATTAVKKEVVDAMMPYFTEIYGNPSSIFYDTGQIANTAVQKARESIANIFGAKPSEIYFTASGSESDNWAIKGVLEANSKKGKNHVIISRIEHPAVLSTCQYLEKNGFEVTYLPVDSNGLVSLKDLSNAITEKTAIVSIMYANNEIGTIEPIKELCEIAHKHGVLFHTDAVQAAGIIPLNVVDLGVDLMSVSAHKFHGPKGIGMLYIKSGVKALSQIHGGQQERGRRAGTENVPYIIGFSKALEIAYDNIEEKIKRITSIRDKIISSIEENIPYIKLNGHREKRLPGNVNFSFKYIEGESLLLRLSLAGFAASSGSACASASLDPSHVLLAIGLPHEIAHGSLRISIGDQNTEEEADKLLGVLPGIVDTLRQMSPLYEEIRSEK